MNGNDIIEYIESMNGLLEDKFIETYNEEFMRFVEENYYNPIREIHSHIGANITKTTQSAPNWRNLLK